MRLTTLAVLLHSTNAAFECVRDAHGCCSSAGYFFCGSSGRCVGKDDPCEDGGGAAAATCGATLRRDGAVASWDLKGLTRTSSLLDYEAEDGADKVIFNVCANVNPPKVCPGETPAAAYAIHEQKCTAVAGSAADAAMASLKPLVGADPTQGVALTYKGAGDCSFLLRVRCAPSAVAPSAPKLVSASDCSTITEVESVHGCPLGCARDRAGAACAGRGQCVWDGGAVCRCDPGTTGTACAEDVNGGPAARARWRFAVVVLVVALCAAVVAARCVAFRKRRLATLRARGTYATVDADAADDEDHVELGASLPFDPFPYEDDHEQFDAPPGSAGRRDE